MTLTDDDIDRLVVAVETIEESLAILAELQSIDFDTYRSEPKTQDIVERRFVKATEATLDIAEVIAVNELDEQPDSNPAKIQALANANVLSESVRYSMIQTARFRNVLAHTYGDVIDHQTVYEALQDLDRYRKFLVEIRTYLDGTGIFDE
jgi:uncharacterized protein YutE (UPF0331/DUF86 family)